MMANTFKWGQVVRSKGMGHIMKCHQAGRLIDFLPDIKRFADDDILEGWIRDFKKKGIPYAICDRGDRLILWKEKG